MTNVELARDPALEALTREVARLPEAASRAIAVLREAAGRALQAQRLPTLRDESYRFLPLTPLTETAFGYRGDREARVELAAIAPWLLDEAATSRLVFVDGVYAPELSRLENDASGLVVATLGAADEALESLLGSLATIDDDVFTALNTRFLEDGVLVSLPADAVLAAPLHVLFVSTSPESPVAVYPRVFVQVGANARLTLVEDYVAVGTGRSLTNAVSEVVVGPGARVQHVRVQRESLAAVHIGRSAVSIDRDAEYSASHLNFGARLARHNVDIHLAAPGAHAVLNCLTFISGDQASDTHSMLDHAREAGQSQQLNKCVVGGAAHAVFNGRILVREGAQATDSRQASRNVLLSDRARVDTKPQLEIFADDVKCAHGATVGQLEADELFYLRSRGLDEAAARALLTYAFAADILERIPVVSLAKRLERFVLEATQAPAPRGGT